VGEHHGEGNTRLTGASNLTTALNNSINQEGSGGDTRSREGQRWGEGTGRGGKTGSSAGGGRA
jgi:hypothetical protein